MKQPSFTTFCGMVLGGALLETEKGIRRRKRRVLLIMKHCREAQNSNQPSLPEYISSPQLFSSACFSCTVHPETQLPGTRDPVRGDAGLGPAPASLTIRPTTSGQQINKNACSLRGLI